MPNSRPGVKGKAEAGIGLPSLNRPRRYNAVSRKMMEELEAFRLDQMEDSETNVIILRGKGERG